MSVMLFLGVVLPMVLTGGGCDEILRFDNNGPAKNTTVPDTLALPRDVTVAADDAQEMLRAAASSPFAEGVAASPEYNISGSESTWSTDPLAEPVAQIIVVRHGVSDFATESDVTERTNEVLNASGNPDSPLPFLKDKRQGGFQDDEGRRAAEPTTPGGDVASVLQPPPRLSTETSLVPGHDVPAASVPARPASEPTEECTEEGRVRNKERRSGVEPKVMPRLRMAPRKSVMRPRKSSRGTLRKVKVVLSRANRTNRTTTTPPPSLPLLPPPPLAGRADSDRLTLRERGCLPLETSPAVQDRSTCPFRFLTSFDRRRLPRLVTTVRCMCPGSPCSSRRGYRCLEVSRPVTLMRRVGRVYVDTLEEMPVACVCAYVGRKSRGRSP
ncbi:uncharacterized protein [Dermacentor andersoni]|uniref:uncharacterized protein n=1 Tax=Dermacentor andersoni TaxID=34620 RepID=UPI0021558BEA|nr:uncharacterized protein LOC126548641 [Dermacentor andersoni]